MSSDGNTRLLPHISLPRIGSVLVSGLLIGFTAAQAGTIDYRVVVEAEPLALGSTTDTTCLATVQGLNSSACTYSTLGTVTEPLVPGAGFSARIQSTALASRTFTSGTLTVVTDGSAEAEFSVFSNQSLMRIGMSADSNGVGAGNPSVVVNADATIDARVRDDFELLVPASLLGTPLSMTVQTKVQGEMTDVGGSQTNALLQVSTQAGGGFGSDFDSEFKQYFARFGAVVPIDDLLATSADIQRSGINSPIIQGNFFFSMLLLGGGPDFKSDFLNTVGLEIILPPGVTMRSQSGLLEQFVLGPTQSVPEPATLALLGLALGGLAVARRRKLY